MSSAVIVGFKRSPFTISRKGALANARPEDILSQVINALVTCGLDTNVTSRTLA